MTKGDETRLRNLLAKQKAEKLTRIERLHLNRLSEKQKAEA